jgi:hypothetical protein
LIVEQLRHYRDSGLGDAPVRTTVDDPAAITGARASSWRQALFGDFWLRIRLQNGRDSRSTRLHGPVY